MRLLPLLPAVLLAASGLAACGGDDDGSGAGAGGTGGTTLVVFAAASLTDSFGQLEQDFEASHEGVDVQLQLGGSSDLVTQVQNGADADVLATADEANMDKLSADELGAEPQVFATNTLEIATQPGNPDGIAGLADVAEGSDVDLVTCAPEVPCGAAAQGVAEAAGVALDPVSEEQSVTDVLGKVTSGQADAGLVYRTDVIAAGDEVTGVEVPEAADVVNRYPIAPLASSDQAELAAEFVALVLSDEGQQVLADAGFGAP
ncbi:molybdate ABC transporter substrate-binding protein [Nocardioides litoris]|uniref:molybdate ABC transporter substrate-binding protein n=1 Tax=Nocardioides litoris TaxID=1926648 RepID=UPI0011217AD7|nr:molybdate ABC transporter substrate-binding protein [Nocardioides litoris]